MLLKIGDAIQTDLNMLEYIVHAEAIKDYLYTKEEDCLYSKETSSYHAPTEVYLVQIRTEVISHGW